MSSFTIYDFATPFICFCFLFRPPISKVKCTIVVHFTMEYSGQFHLPRAFSRNNFDFCSLYVRHLFPFPHFQNKGKCKTFRFKRKVLLKSFR